MSAINVTCSAFRKYAGRFVATSLVLVLMVRFFLPKTIADNNCIADKPIIIDVRTNHTSDSIDTHLCIVDGVIRHLHSENDIQKLALNGKHEIRPINKFESSHFESGSFIMKSQDDSLRVNLLASMVGQVRGRWFGFTVSGVDDFNGDGIDDFAISAPQGLGDVYIYYGGEEIDTVPDIWITGGGTFGDAVANGGDINNDGFGDLLVGEPVYGDSRQGAVYVFWGGSPLGRYTLIEGNQNELLLGTSVASLSDINKDGYDDFIAGSQHNVGNGKAFLFFGGDPFDPNPDLVFTGEKKYDYFGFTVNSAGDVNGDGFPDIIIGNCQFRVEKAYLFFGGNILDTIPDLIFSGPLDSDFGWMVGSAGDINNDGYDDVIVSAHWYTEQPGVSTPGYGRVYIYHGATDMDTTADIIISGTQPRTCFGLHFSKLGDINYDYYSDLAIGAHCDTSDVGKARIFLGGSEMSTIDTMANLIIQGENIEDRFTYSISGTHDVNGDRRNDLIIGAFLFPDNWQAYGKAYVYSIHSGLTIDPTPLPRGIVDFTYYKELIAHNGVPPYTWELISGLLPEGLLLETNGIIRGIPAVADTARFVVQVMDTEVNVDNHSFVLETCQGSKGDVDCNGVVNIQDAIQCVNILLRITNYTEYQMWAADCNDDRIVNVLDVICILILLH